MGVADGWPSSDRSHSSFLYRLGPVTLLIDCGESVSRSYKATGWDYNLIDRILISHMHLDHVGGFFMLLQGLWLEGRSKGLRIHMPAEGIDTVRHMVRAGYIFDELLGFSLRYAPLRRGRAIKIAPGVQVTPYPTTHLCGFKRAFYKSYRAPFEAFCFLIESGSRRVAHSGDLGKVQDLDPLLRKPVDVLLCEVAHVGLEELGCYLKNRRVKRVVLVHLPESMWREPARTRERARQALEDTPFTVASEGEEIPL